MTKTQSRKSQIAILASVAVIALGMFTVGNSYATGSLLGVDSSENSMDEEVQSNDGSLTSDGDGETNDDVQSNDGSLTSDGDGETNDD